MERITSRSSGRLTAAAAAVTAAVLLLTAFGSSAAALHAEAAGKDTGSRGAQRGGFIPFTVQEHRAELKSGSDVYVSGTYAQIILDPSAEEVYPGLGGAVGEWNETERAVFTETCQGAEDMAAEMFSSGWTSPFEVERYVRPTRADEAAFSCMTSIYTYLGGAHGFTYFVGMNVDPATGGSISFADVVKTDEPGLAEVLYDELMRQNEDLEKDYITGTGRSAETYRDETIMESIRERLKDGGENIAFALTYDGVLICYEDYAMGSYAAGVRVEEICFADYPEYFTGRIHGYGGDVPVIESQFERLEAEETETVPNGPRTLDVGYMSAYVSAKEGAWDELGYYYSGAADMLTVSDDYPALQKKLDRFNRHSERDLRDEIDDFGYAQKEGHDASGGEERGSYYMNKDLVLCRADTSVFSFIESTDVRGAQDYSARTFVGHNLDTDTGRDIDLTQVVTDTELLKEAFAERIGDQLSFSYVDPDENEWIIDTFSSLVDERTAKVSGRRKKTGNFVSDEELSWNLCYEGLWLHLNRTVNYPRPEKSGPPMSVFIPFRGNEKLFDRTYTRAPARYAFALPRAGSVVDFTCMDINGDGTYGEIGVAAFTDEYGFLDSVYLAMDEKWITLEDVYGYELYPYILRDQYGEYYLYLEALTDNDYHELYVYRLSGEEPQFMGTCEGSVRFSEWDREKEERIPGHVMTTPARFYKVMRDQLMGTNDVTGLYCMDYDGMPILVDGEWLMYDEVVIWPRATRDIPAQRVSEDGLVSGDAVVPAGTSCRPYRRGADESFIDIMTEDGDIFRLTFDENENGSSVVDGDFMWDLFEDLMYAG